MSTLTPQHDLGTPLPAPQREAASEPERQNGHSVSVVSTVFSEIARLPSRLKKLFAAAPSALPTEPARPQISDAMVPTVLRSYVVGLSVRDTRYLEENPDINALSDEVEELATRIEANPTAVLLEEAYTLMDRLEALGRKWDDAWRVGKATQVARPHRQPILSAKTRDRAFRNP